MLSKIPRNNILNLVHIDFDINNTRERRKEFYRYESDVIKKFTKDNSIIIADEEDSTANGKKEKKRPKVMILKVKNEYFFCWRDTEQQIEDVQRSKMIEEEIELYCPYCMEKFEIVNSNITYIRHEKNINNNCPYKRDDDGYISEEKDKMRQYYILYGYVIDWLKSEENKIKVEIKDNYSVSADGQNIHYTFREETIDKDSIKVYENKKDFYLIISTKTEEGTQIDFATTTRTLRNNKNLLEKYLNGNVILYEISWLKNVGTGIYEDEAISLLYNKSAPIYDELYSQVEVKAQKERKDVLIGLEEASRLKRDSILSKKSINEFYLNGTIYRKEVEKKKNKNNKTYISGGLCIQTDSNYYIKVNSYNPYLMKKLDKLQISDEVCLKVRISKNSYVDKNNNLKIDDYFYLEDIKPIDYNNYGHTDGIIDGILVGIDVLEHPIKGCTHRVSIVSRSYNVISKKHDNYELIDNILTDSSIAEEIIKSNLIGSLIHGNGYIEQGFLEKYVFPSRHGGRKPPRPRLKKELINYMKLEGLSSYKKDSTGITRKYLEEIKNIIFSKYKVNIFK